MNDRSLRIQCDGFFITQDRDGFGNVIALQSNWDPKYIEAIQKHKVKEIILSSYNGWLQSDVGFLAALPRIEGVDVVSELVTDISPIFNLNNLKRLGLAECKPKRLVDFSKLKHLREVFLTWRNAYNSVFTLPDLQKVNIVGYPCRDLSAWKENPMLQELLLSSSKLESLAGIERFPNLTLLDLFRCRKLKSLEDLAHSTTLRELTMDKCNGIFDLSPVSHLLQLRKLAIEDCGDIDSLSPIAKCTKLEFLQVAGNTTIIDGNLSELTRLRHLKEVLLRARKHYTHTDEELEKRIY